VLEQRSSHASVIFRQPGRKTDHFERKQSVERPRVHRPAFPDVAVIAAVDLPH
jgi:hypothetical protein